MRCSLADPTNAHLAVDNFLRCLLPQGTRALLEFYDRRWARFNSQQLLYVLSWLECRELEVWSYFDNEEIKEFSLRLGKYTERAVELQSHLNRILGKSKS